MPKTDDNRELYNAIYQKACDYLSRREHSVLELYNKLHKKFNNDEELLREIVEMLQEKNYLSNERFAEKFVESRLRRHHGPLLIQKQLRTKGITNEIWLEIWEKFENQAVDFCQAALSKWMRTHHKPNLELDQDRQKAFRYLASKGYYQHMIYEALAKLEK